MRQLGALVLLVCAACGGSGGVGGPAPVPHRCDPEAAFADGGTPIVLHGEGFQADATQVHVNGDAATEVEVADTGTLRFRAPPGAVGPAEVRVEGASGSGSLPNGLVYYRFPPNFPAADVRLDTDAPGADMSTDPVMARSGDRLYVAWQDGRDDPDAVYGNVSADGGATWLPSDLRLDAEDVGRANSAWLDICARGDDAHLVWVDESHDPHGLMVRSTNDGGQSWSAAVRLDAGDGTHGANYPKVGCTDSTVVVVWSDRRSGQSDIYARVSEDRGATWNAPMRLDSDPEGATFSTSPSLCSAGPHVYVAWTDARNGRSDVYFHASHDGGRSWPGADRRLDVGLPREGNSAKVGTTCDGLHFYAAWQEDTDGRADVYVQASHDGGGTWLAAAERLDSTLPGASDSFRPALYCLGEEVLVVFMDDRRGAYDVYHRRSADGGLTWGGSDARLNAALPPGLHAASPRVCGHGRTAFVAWVDDRGGVGDVYVRCTRDMGRTWPAAEARVEGEPPGTSGSFPPAICCTGARLLLAWSDWRDGSPDIFFTASTP